MADDDVELRTVLAGLNRNRRPMLVVFAAVILVALIVASALPTSFSATVDLLVSEAADTSASDRAQSHASPALANARVETEVELLRSDALALAVVDQLGLVTEAGGAANLSALARLGSLVLAPAELSPEMLRTAAAQNLARNTEVVRKGLTFVISVTVRADSSERAAELANTIADLHITRQQSLRAQILENTRNALESELAELRRRLEQAGEDDRAAYEYQTVLSRFGAVAGQLDDIDGRIRLPSAGISVVSPALPPISPSLQQKRIVLAAGLLAALSAAVGTALLRESLVRGISNANELFEFGGFADVVDLPESELQTTDRLTVADEIIDAPLSHFSESVRTLRSSVDLSMNKFKRSSGATAKVILVTSVENAEGKTTTSLALARSFALAGRKTLLLDCDFRNPSLGRQIGMHPKSGFLDYLQNPEAMQMPATFYGRDPASTVSVVVGREKIFSGTDAVLASRAFGLVLEQARKVFDVVVIDSPPVLPVIDSRVLAAEADAIVLAVRWAGTGRDDVVDAMRRLSSGKRPECPIIGALSRSKQSTSAYYFRPGARYSAAR